MNIKDIVLSFNLLHLNLLIKLNMNMQAESSN